MTARPAEGVAAAGGTLLLLPELDGVGGIQRLGRDTLEAFRRALPDRRLDVLVLNDAVGPGAPVPEGCGRSRVRFALRSVALARRRPRLVFLFHRNLLPLAPLLRVASGGASVALLLHGVEAHPSASARERLALRWVARVLAVSPQTAESFPAPARCVRQLWPCSLPYDWAAVEDPPPAGGPLRLLSVARLARSDGYKGVDHTIEALAGVPEAALDVVGDGDDRSRLEELTRTRGVAGRVRFHGGVPDTRLRELYAACDLFVLPSGGEGFGIVYLEAMSFGRPCIAADAGGAPHAVREGVSGWLVPYGRPDVLAARLRELAADPETVRRAGRGARRLVGTEFSFDAMVERARALHAAS